MKRFALIVCLVGVGLGGAACWPGGLGIGPSSSDPHQITEPEVRSFLTQFCSHTATTVETAALEMQQENSDRNLGRRATLWKMTVASECQRASNEPEALSAFLETWVLAVGHAYAMTEGEASDRFGDQQPIAVDAAERILARIEAIVPHVIPPDRLEAARAGVQQVAREQARQNSLSSEGGSLGGSIGTVLDQPVFSWATGLALSPFRALEGVDEGAQAARQLAVVADRFAAIAEQLPRQVRWQTELLLYEAEDRETVEVLRRSVEEIGASADRLSRTAENLPEELRVSLRLVLDDLSDAQSGLQPTLAQTKATVQALDKALVDFASATTALDSTMVLIRDWPKSEPDPDAPPGRPFDIREYTATFDAASAALEELRAALGEVEGLATSPLLTTSVEEVDRTVRGLVDHVALRIAQLVGLILIGTLLVVLIVSMVRRRGVASGG